MSTLKCFDATVQSLLVVVKITPLPKCLLAAAALNPPPVTLDMCVQVIGSGEALIAHVTRIWTITGVTRFMPLLHRSLRKTLTALFAYEITDFLNSYPFLYAAAPNHQHTPFRRRKVTRLA